jgi:hypothetical protein
VEECERFMKSHSPDSRPLEGSAAVQSIYQTLSNHSKIIKRHVQNLNAMRVQAGLSKCPDLSDDIEVFEPTKSLGYGYFEKKSLLKAKPFDLNYTHKSSNKSRSPLKSDRVTLDDLTAGRK